MVSPDSRLGTVGIYIQYITKIVVLVSEPVRGRSRATELPCSDFVSQMWGWLYITKIVVLVSEPVRGRSRVTELPCYLYFPYLALFALYLTI